MDVLPTTIQARRVSRRLRRHGMDVVSETVGKEVRVTLEVLGPPTPWNIVVHCQPDTPREVLETGLRGWADHYAAQLRDDAGVFTDSQLEAAVAALGRAAVLEALEASTSWAR